MSHCKRETTLFVLPKEDTTRNQRLSCIYNNSTQILDRVQHILRRLCPEPGRVTLSYNSSVLKDCFYKVERFQLCTLLTHSL